MRFVLFLFMSLVLISCESTHQLYEVSDVPLSSKRDVSKSPVPVTFSGENSKIHSLDMSGEAFNTVGEWYDNENILYINDKFEGSDIFRYDIYQSEKELFYSTDSPVITMKANEDHSLFLIHTSNASNEAEIIIVDEDGKENFKWQVDAYDLYYNWNPYNKDQIFLTAFLEDWSYETYLLDVGEETVKNYDILQPFIQWISNNEISYLKWDQNEPSFFAPLFSYSLENKNESLLFENIISYSTFINLLVTVELDKDKDSYGVYHFFDTKTNQLLHEYKLPLLTDYSKWNIPYEDYAVEQRLFYTFRPYTTGSFDTYSQKYEFVSFNMKNGEEKSLIQKVDSKPIKISPNGYLCLYGYQFENIINLHTNDIIPLIYF